MMETHSRVPGSIAVFGAAGHIGGPLARFVRYKAPQVHLRLISRSAAKAHELRGQFPTSDVAVADYLDLASLERALFDMQGVFVVTPHFIDEAVAMGNLIASLRRAGCLTQLIRIVGFQPDAKLAMVPKVLQDFGSGVATQHFVARELLDASGLPVTYLNLGASMMDNFLRNTSLRKTRTLVWPIRRVPYVDPREVGEAAARVFLSGEPGYLHHVHTLNNGHDLLSGSEVAELMSEVLQQPVYYDGTMESYLAMTSERLEQTFGRKGAGEYLWNFFEYEKSVEINWSLNDFLERTLGRKPTTLRAWIQEHCRQLFPHEGSPP
jgi:uncharacterized protein YbjT (DUF2867 family)